MIQAFQETWKQFPFFWKVFSLSLKLLNSIFFWSTPGDVLQNYCHVDDLANVARVVFAITIVCTYPLECFVCREVRVAVSISQKEVWQRWMLKMSQTHFLFLLIDGDCMLKTVLISWFCICGLMQTIGLLASSLTDYHQLVWALHAVLESQRV